MSDLTKPNWMPIATYHDEDPHDRPMRWSLLCNERSRWVRTGFMHSGRWYYGSGRDAGVRATTGQRDDDDRPTHWAPRVGGVWE